ncbi:Carbon monoxide dehydrogenase medium chain [Luteitalea pratensis]|uniref:Carbon monoxide dehydrogenase medium chain n=1 Tax=Luteitalea pratensis TaxID=1855912 RepID=A0A143PTX7_LUTPR|nr:xanthine dehydrogenase family protein subunit M [Luteitalea pratensis]AMY11254.1 Carbon monoxide dehydrogenase medium chain [Luteitalea pratensis]
MIPTPFEYARATSLDDALVKLKAAGEGGKIIAGGHSLVPLMKLRLSEPQALVDISRIPELQGIEERDGKIVVGAATVHHDVASSAVLQARCPAVAEAAASIGDPQVRNRGTIGGSVAHADPAADMPAVLLALDAEIHLKSPRGPRVVKAADFFRGLFTVDMRHDEIITSVQFAPVRSAAYAKLHQRASHYAIVGVAAALDVRDGVIATARIGLTGATAHAVRLAGVEKALAGQPLSQETIERAAGVAGQDLGELNADIHASAEYRRAMVQVFARRALSSAMARS